MPVLLLSSTIVLVTAMLLMNLQRQYPKFWVAQIPSAPPVEKKEDKETKKDVTEGSEASSARDTLQDMERGPL